MLTAFSRTQVPERRWGRIAGARPLWRGWATKARPGPTQEACLFNKALPAHTSNCLVMAIGVIVHRPVPGRARGSSSTFAKPISP